MADQTDTKITETKAEILPRAEAAKAEPAKAVEAKAPPAAAAPKTVKTAKPARKASQRRKAKVRKPAVAVAKPARAAAKLIKKGEKIVNKQTNKAAETAQIAADQVRNAFGDVSERAKTAMERNARIVEEMADLTRGNVEAIVASSKVAAKGVETLGQGAAEYSRKSFEEASAALKSFAEVKSPTDFFRLQSDFARSAFDGAVAESARLSETVLKLAGDVAQPINSRYAVAAERVKTLAA